MESVYLLYMRSAAISFISEELPERSNCSFFLLTLSDAVSHFLAKNKEKLESDLHIQLLFIKEAVCHVVPDKIVSQLHIFDL